MTAQIKITGDSKGAVTALDNTNKSLKQVDSSSKGTTASLGKLNAGMKMASASTLSSQMDRLGKSISKVGTTLKSSGGGFGTLTKGLGSLSNSMKALPSSLSKVTSMLGSSGMGGALTSSLGSLSSMTSMLAVGGPMAAGIAGLVAGFALMGAGIKTAFDELEKSAEGRVKMEEWKKSVDDLKSAWSDTMKALSSGMGDSVSIVGDLQMALDSVKNLLVQMRPLFQTFGEILGPIFKSLVYTIKGFIDGLAKVYEWLGKISGRSEGVKSVKDSFNSLNSEISRTITLSNEANKALEAMDRVSPTQRVANLSREIEGLDDLKSKREEYRRILSGDARERRKYSQEEIIEMKRIADMTEEEIAFKRANLVLDRQLAAAETAYQSAVISGQQVVAEGHRKRMDALRAERAELNRMSAEATVVETPNAPRTSSKPKEDPRIAQAKKDLKELAEEFVRTGKYSTESAQQIVNSVSDVTGGTDVILEAFKGIDTQLLGFTEAQREYFDQLRINASSASELLNEGLEINVDTSKMQAQIDSMIVFAEEGGERIAVGINGAMADTMLQGYDEAIASAQQLIEENGETAESLRTLAVAEAERKAAMDALIGAYGHLSSAQMNDLGISDEVISAIEKERDGVTDLTTAIENQTAIRRAAHEEQKRIFEEQVAMEELKAAESQREREAALAALEAAQEPAEKLKEQLKGWSLDTIINGLATAGRTLGEVLAEGEKGSKKMGEALKRMAGSAATSLASIMFAAAAPMLAAGSIPQGVALIAGGVALNVIAGALGAKKAKKEAPKVAPATETAELVGRQSFTSGGSEMRGQEVDSQGNPRKEVRYRDFNNEENESDRFGLNRSRSFQGV